MVNTPNIRCSCGAEESCVILKEEFDKAGRLLAFSAKCTACGHEQRNDKRIPLRA